MSRYLLLELEGGLDHSREVGIFCSAKQIVGVRSVSDLAFVTQETLDTILLKEPTEPLMVLEREPEQMPMDWWAG